MRYCEKYEPAEMEKWRNKHLGETMIVCGCGPSIANIDRKIDIPTIGVNDIWGHHEVDYVLMIDSYKCFNQSRVARIMNGTPKHYFLATHCHMSWRSEKKELKPFTIIDEGLMPGTNVTSPSLAVGLAMFMGAKRIGVIGVDLTDHPTLKKNVARVQKGFSELLGVAWTLGDVKLFNLSTGVKEGQDILLKRMTPERFLSTQVEVTTSP